MIRPELVGRFIRYWYTYRTFVAVLLGISLSGVMYWLYVEQVAGDSGQSVPVNISVHPEDRIMAATGATTDPNIVLVGIDNQSAATLASFPFSRDNYASALANLLQTGAAGGRWSCSRTAWPRADAAPRRSIHGASRPTGRSRCRVRMARD